MPDQATKPAVISISSQVARGSVGNRCAVFALETCGFPVWMVPTVILPWHPGHGQATKIIPEAEQLYNFLNDITNSPWIGEVKAILTGYMANAKQIAIVSDMIKTLRAKNPDLIYICDPVIGDAGGLYVLEETAVAIRDQLLPISDIATPNLYELAWLSGSEVPASIQETVQLAKTLPPPSVLVTSAPNTSDSKIGNLFVSDRETLLATHERMENPPNGTGDLTAAVFLANLLSGSEFRDNLELTTASVFEVLRNATGRGSDELMLETDAPSLLDPRVKIEVVEV
ncbi:MAG: pyridoxal kinase PdxY [Pseudomonadota bacterium]